MDEEDGASSLFLVEEDVHKLLHHSSHDQARGGGGNPCYAYDDDLSAAASRHRHGNVLKKLQYIPELHQFVALEYRSVDIALYNGDDFSLSRIMRPRSNRGVPDAVTYVPERDVMISCSGDLRMKWWEMGDECTEVEANSWNLENSQVCLQWVSEHQRLYSGSMLGMVHTWDIDHRAECAKALHGHGPSHSSPTASGLIPPAGKGEAVTDLAYLPGLDKLCSAGLDSRICIWDVDVNERTQLLGRTFEKSAKPKGHVRGVLSLAYLEHHKLLVSAGFDHDAFVWSPFGDSVLFKLEGHRTSLTSVERLGGTESPHLLSCDEDGIFKVWDIRRAADCLETFRAHEQGVRGVACTACCMQAPPPWGETARAEGEEESLAARTRRTRRASASASKLAELSSSRRASASASSKLADAALSSPLKGCAVADAEPLLPPRVLVSTSSGSIGQIHVFSPAVLESTLASEGTAHAVSVLGCAHDPAADRLMTAAGSTVKVWSVSTGVLVKAFRDVIDGTITALVSCIEQRIFFVGDDRGGVSMFNFYSGALLKRLLHHRLEVSALVATADTLFSMSWDGSIVVHAIANAQLEPIKSRPFIADPTHAHQDDLMCCAILLSAEAGKCMSHSSPTKCFWPPLGVGGASTPLHGSGGASSSHSHKRPHAALTQQLLATGAADGAVRLWELETGKLAAHLKHPAGAMITCMRFLTPLPMMIAADNFGAQIWGLPKTSSGKYPSIVRFALTDFGPPVLDEDNSDGEEEQGEECFPAGAPKWATKLAVPAIVAVEWDGNEQRLYVADDYGQLFCFRLDELEHHHSPRRSASSGAAPSSEAVKPRLVWRRRPLACAIRVLRVARSETHIRDAALITTYADGRVALVHLRDGAPLGWLQDGVADLDWNFPQSEFFAAQATTLAPFPGLGAAAGSGGADFDAPAGYRQDSGAASKEGDEEEEGFSPRSVSPGADVDGSPARALDPESTAMQWWRAKARESATTNASAAIAALNAEQAKGRKKKKKMAKARSKSKRNGGREGEKTGEDKFGRATARPENWISTKGLLAMPKGKDHTLTENKQCRSAAAKLLASFDDWNSAMERDQERSRR